MSLDGSWPPEDFPNLKSSDGRVTSESTSDYNCLGWAAGEMVWWEPDPDDTYYWPPGAPRTYTLEAYIAAYKSIGYQPCDTAELEDGFEKIVLYRSEEEYPPHAARQLPSGRWTSKLGPYEDIEHSTLDCLRGDLYGQPFLYLRRPTTHPSPGAAGERLNPEKPG